MVLGHARVVAAAARLKEAQKLGFTKAIVPEAARAEAIDGLTLYPVGTLSNLVVEIASAGRQEGAAPLRRVGRQEAEADRRSAPSCG